jgi:hypothetical protein
MKLKETKFVDFTTRWLESELSLWLPEHYTTSDAHLQGSWEWSRLPRGLKELSALSICIKAAGIL